MVCDFSPVAFHVFGFPVHWYSFAYIFGIIFAFKLTEFLMKKSEYDMDLKLLDDFVGVVVLGIILGGRLGHVLFYDPGFYRSDPLEIFKIWKGGMSFFGGFIGIVLATYWFCKKHHLNFLSFFDYWSVGTPIGLFFGRIANFINGELLGKQSSEIAWSVVFGDGIPRHPSQIYEAILEGIVLFLIMVFAFYKKQYKFDGRLSGIFCLGYGINRFIGECFRVPDSLFSWDLFFSTGINLNQYFCFAIMALGVFLIYRSLVNEIVTISGKD
ncbi:MAG: prolipoprotein diacylglyceryl transferase [Alphaproteobacteria bacterium]|nr:prolipoprotein diacylglyceryl transferase [Alphaproteobacteria bacterium]